MVIEFIFKGVNEMKKTILTGIRPTGNLHIGHYFGATRQWVDMQDKYHTYILIADVQALTDHYDHPEKVRENIWEIVLDILSCGIDPSKVTFVLQSQIKEIAELTVFYSNLVTVNRLFRNPTVKTEVLQKKQLFGENGESITYGFLGYPVSQAADITAFQAEVIPVGEDQIPLIEQAREIVRKFNSIYGETLLLPKAVTLKTARIKGLDGNNKMGKSLGNAVYLVDSDEELTKKVMNAVTDPKKIKKDDPADPEVCMVYYYHQLFSENDLDTVCSECKQGKRGCVACKKQLIENMIRFLEPIRKRRAYYETHQEEVKDILKKGTLKGQEKAKETMDLVKKRMKIDYDL